MTSGELKALSDKANAWDSVLSAMMERLPQAFKAAPSPLECVLLWINRASNEPATALSRCPFCDRPADSEGGILHSAECDGLKDAGLTKLQHHVLVSRAAQPQPAEQKDEQGRPMTYWGGLAQPPPSDYQDETITSLCDRLLKINNICHDRTLRREERLRQVEEWSAGFMHPPGSGPTKGVG